MLKNGGERAAAFAGEDLDHTADGLGAVEAGAWTAYDLDAFDLLDGNLLKGGGAEGRRTHFDTVDEHQHVVGFGAAEVYRGGFTGAAVVARC